jgi:hypothetical protein
MKGSSSSQVRRVARIFLTQRLVHMNALGTAGSSFHIILRPLDFPSYAMAPSQASRMVWISSGVGLAG